MHKFKHKTWFFLCVLIVLLISIFPNCSNDKQIYKVGVIDTGEGLYSVIEGFKEGMNELGYEEGDNIQYIHAGSITNISTLPEAAKSLVDAEADLIFTVTTPAALAAKNATANKDIPVVFTVVTDPMEAGIVESLQNPGGLITGVTFGTQEPRRLEWLTRISPNVKKIYVPYNIKDTGPVLAFKMVQAAAKELDLEIIAQEFHDLKTLTYAVENIPQEADAIFILPDSMIAVKLPDLIANANQLKLPTSGPNINVIETSNLLSSFSMNTFLVGKQGARLADLIIQGANPSDLPVETAEFFLAINLKVAKTIDLSIPDSVLRQADVIFRYGPMNGRRLPNEY